MLIFLNRSVHSKRFAAFWALLIGVGIGTLMLSVSGAQARASAADTGHNPTAELQVVPSESLEPGEGGIEIVAGPRFCTTETFQSGIDTYLYQGSSTSNYGGLYFLGAVGSPRYSALVEWDLAGSTFIDEAYVVGAQIILRTLNSKTSGAPTYVYPLNRGWNEGFGTGGSCTSTGFGASWNAPQCTGASWQSVGANGVPVDRDNDYVTLTPTSFPANIDLTLNMNPPGLAVVEDWLNGSRANHGFTIQNNLQSGEYWSFASFNYATPNLRPRLSVTHCYHADYGDSPASFSTATARHLVFPDTDFDTLPDMLGSRSAIWLGATIDGEISAPGSSGADLDDATTTDDEDGVTLVDLDTWQANDGGYVAVTFNSSEAGDHSGWLAAWFDWDGDGIFDDGDYGSELALDQAVNWSNGAANTPSAAQNFFVTAPDGSLVDDPNRDIHYRVRLFESDPGEGLSAFDGTFSNGEIEDGVFDASSTPVTLSYFATTAKGEQVTFDWSTATAAGNVGFNLYGEVDGRLVQLNEQIVPSHHLDSLDRQDYAFAVRTTAGAFYLEEVDIGGNVQRFGPFSPGDVGGDRTEMEAIDWAAIRAEHEAKTAARQAAILAAAARGPESGYPVFDVLVEQDGLYRISHAELLAAGLDLTGVPAGDIALTNQGEPVAIYVGQVPHFAPPSIGPVGGFFNEYGYIEFVGEALDTLYSRTNVYKLLVDRTQAQRIALADGKPSPSAVPATTYMQTSLTEENHVYSFASPTDDPWYDRELRAYTTPVSWDFALDTTGYLPAGGAATLMVNMWGTTDWPASPDHHVIIELNGVVLADELFDGIADHPVAVEIPGGLLEGTNTLTIRMPGDTGVDWDIVNLESYGLSYPRAFMAQGGTLAFSGNAERFDVDGLQTNNVVAYQIAGNEVTKLFGMQPAASGNGYLVPVRGSGQEADYVVADVQALLSPGLAPALVEEDITSGPVDYLMISHPDFTAGLAPLVTAREAEGMTVKVVSSEQVYLQFSGSVFDPQAIKDYIAYATANMGLQYVLLVGGDTYDYFNYATPGAMSFIPSLYAQTDWIVKFAPVDPLFTDTDGDQVPNVPIGRFPVRTTAELTAVVEKTLSYADKDYGLTGVFSADKFFGADSDSFISQLPAGWTVEAAHLDDMTVADARTVLIGAMNEGAALTSFVGHSGMDRWTYAGLFNTTDAAALTNFGRPTVVTQWGCWNTYYVSPQYNTLGHKLMLSGTNGGAAVLGASTLTLASSERILGQLMMPYLTQPGMRLGDAMQTAKAEMAVSHPNNLDVLLGWTLLGDPTIIIQP